MSTTGTTTTGTTTTTSSTADAAKGAASDVAGEATSAAADVKETVKSEVSSVVSEASQRAGSLLRTSQDELRSQAEGRAKDLSSALDGVARQLGTMADAADDPDSTVAQLSRTAAEQLRKQSQRLEQGGLEGLVDDARRLARNRPGAFMLGTVAAGFAFGRLAKHANLKQAADTAKQELTGGGEPSSGPGTGGAHLASPPPSSTGSLPAAPSIGTVPAAPDPTGASMPGGMGGRS
jgi:ABC-type transporter Mla subunit MlaD